MRAISFGLVICIFVSLFTFSSYGLDLKLDGVVGNTEWKGASIHEVIDASLQSNCNIDFATLFCVSDKSNYSVFLAFKYMSEDFDSLNNNSAIEIRVNDSDCATFYANGDEMKIDYDKFDAEYVFSFNEKSKETYCEMRLGMKYGVEEDVMLGIRIFDYMGRPSNYYEIKIFEETEVVGENSESSKSANEKETVTETETPHKSLSEYEKTTQMTCTTKPVIVAYTTEKESATEKTKENSTTIKESLENKKESVTEKPTQKNENATKMSESETNLSQTEIVTEELISKAISDMKVKEARNSKTIGYSVAAGILVGAVFIAVMATLFKTSNETEKENSDKDDF